MFMFQFNQHLYLIHFIMLMDLVYNVNDGSNITIQMSQENYNTTTLKTYLLSVMAGFAITFSSF
jgi:hypothetical protein